MTKLKGWHYMAKIYIFRTRWHVIPASCEARALKGLIVFMAKMLVGSR